MGKLDAVQIMRRGSTTFFSSSLLFTRSVRKEVLALYAFVRIADDYVDGIPQDREGFRDFRRTYELAADGHSVDNQVITDFVSLCKRRNFDRAWVASFLDAMEQDLQKSVYTSIEETEEYMHGSAGVVGMMMARILELPEDSLPYARALGRAFQYINFVRDIKEDLEMGRTYLPLEDAEEAGLGQLTMDNAAARPNEFKRFVHKQIARYRGYTAQSAPGLKFIPARALVAIKTAADMFDYTAQRIERQPAIVLRTKVKPSRLRVVTAGLRNLILTRHQ